MKKARRVLAVIGLILIGVMYALTIIFALMKHPDSKNWLMAAIFCTIAVPVIIYAMQMVARLLPRLSGKDKAEEADEENRN